MPLCFALLLFSSVLKIHFLIYSLFLFIPFYPTFFPPAYFLSFSVFSSPLLWTYSFLHFVFLSPAPLLSILVTHSSPLRSHFSTGALEVIHFTNLKKPIICLFMTFIVLPITQCYIAGPLAPSTETYLHTHVGMHAHTGNKQHTHTANSNTQRHTFLYSRFDVWVYIMFSSVCEMTNNDC